MKSNNTTAPSLERFLARLYSDPEFLRSFCIHSETVATEFGLSPADVASVMNMNIDDLKIAAESFASKRNAKSAGAP
ncbi:MAG: hypothetical protein ACKVS6_13845 [Planctomycetota bacterium]